MGRLSRMCPSVEGMCITPRSKQPTLEKILTRTRLIDGLLERKNKRVFLIYGKAGQGKSTLIADFVRSAHVEFIWYNLSADEHDPLVLVNRLMSSLPSSPGTALPGYSADSLSGMTEQLIQMLRECSSQHLYLILDRFQLVNPYSDIRKLLNSLVSGLPENVHLIVISREYPQLSVSRMIAERELAAVGDKELSFTPQEAHELFTKVYRIPMSPYEFKEVFEISCGWVTGLLHLAESLELKDADTQREILQKYITQKQLPSLKQFFEEETFQPLSPEIRDFLVRLSVFDRVTPDLVIQVLSKAGSIILEDLVERHLFVERMDAAGKGYTLHPMFAAFLAEKFERLPEEEKARIHRGAADFYTNAGLNDEATHHFLLSRGYTEAQQVFLQRADVLLEEGQYTKLHRLLQAFPEEVRRNDPLLLYYYTITTNLVQPLVSRRTLLSLLEVFRKSGDIAREAKIHEVLLVNYIFYQGDREAVQELVTMGQVFMDEFGPQLMLETRLTLEALLSFGRWWTTPDLDDAFEIALSAEETAYKIGNEEVLIFSRIVLARIYIDRGEFLKSTEILAETEQIINRHPSFRQYEPLLRFYLGDTYFYLGEIDRALDQVEQGLTRTYPGFAFCRYLKLNQVLYLIYLPEVEKAEVVLDSIREENIGENLYTRYLSIYLLQMLLAYRKNQRERAEHYCKRLMDPVNVAMLNTDFPYSYLALAEVLVYLEDYRTAVEILNRLLGLAPAEKFPYPNATAFALLGLIFSRTAEKKKCSTCFEKMNGILEEKSYRNLDICNTALLQNIASVSNLPAFREFPRLKHMTPVQIINQSVSGLFLYTLGSFRIVLNGREVPMEMLSRHRKVMDLLKLLIVHRKRGIGKELLYELFWPGYLERSSRNNLNTIAYRLRKILGEESNYIITDASTIRLNMDLSTIDADNFLEILQLGKQEEERGSMQQALNAYLKAKAVYRGDFLENDLYSDDIRDERENLKKHYLQLLMKLVKIHLDSAKYLQALDYIKGILAKDNLCEPAYRLLMIASTMVGSRSEVPRIYETLNKRLMRYYNIEADPKTTVLRNQLLGGTIPTEVFWRNETLI